ncbi:MAG: LysM peptidoglycan-binding domain-containing protein [Deltaproteobacteria bacterium]
MRRRAAATAGLLAVFFMATGCGMRVHTYAVDRVRPDQDLSSGNLGYVAGAPDPAQRTREENLTRRTFVTEVNFGPRAATKKGRRDKAAQRPRVTTYTVRDNDTLEQIALKIYGEAGKWKQIFEANKDRLKSPDRLYAGQVLRIP